MSKLANYFHTIRYLKFSQVYYRLTKRFINPKVNLLVGKPHAIKGTYSLFPIYKQKLMSEERIKLLNIEQDITASEIWNSTQQAKLWLYNLHYFDDLSADDTEQRSQWQQSLINRWISENPPGEGVGWEPYPTSLRIVNWVKAFIGHISPTQAMLNSLAIQADYLTQTLERDLLANHYFVNGKALIFCGLFFEGRHAQRWLNTGLTIYKQELEEQVLADGGNFELSPMYHVIMLIDLLDLVNIFNTFEDKVESSIVQKTKRYCEKMVRWLMAMSHNDEKISFFNDTAFGICPEIHVVFNYAKMLGIEIDAGAVNKGLYCQDLVESGYVSVKSEDFSLLADLARVGPDYQPAHAHADSLSFEFALAGNRVFVNSGTSEYGVSAERLRQRRTAAHNTVVVDGLDSSAVWSGFRVAKRADVINRQVKQLDNAEVLFSAAHNGFKKQGVNCIHQRSWQVRANSLQISDELLGSFEKAYGYLHLHPDVVLSESSDQSVKLTLVGGQTILLSIAGAKLSVEDSTWHPEFGKVQPNKKLCFDFKSNKVQIEVNWTLN